MGNRQKALSVTLSATVALSTALLLVGLEALAPLRATQAPALAVDGQRLGSKS